MASGSNFGKEQENKPLAAYFLDDVLNSGGDVEIPSLGIKITKRSVAQTADSLSGKPCSFKNSDACEDCNLSCLSREFDDENRR